MKKIFKFIVLMFTLHKDVYLEEVHPYQILRIYLAILFWNFSPQNSVQLQKIWIQFLGQKLAAFGKFIKFGRGGFS